jgi:hypothetical protein
MVNLSYMFILNRIMPWPGGKRLMGGRWYLLAGWGARSGDLFAGAAVLRYSAQMGERWTEEAVFQESERWVHVPRDGRCIEDERRLLVHLPKPWGTTRVWRSWVADEERASDLIEETVDEVRATGGGRILWHTGDRVAPPFMDECLARHGFRTTEKLEVLAFVLINGQEQRLPQIGVPKDLSVELVRDADLLREALRVESEVFRSPPPTGEQFAEYAGEMEKLRRYERGQSSSESMSLAMRFAAYVKPSPSSGGDTPRGIVASAGAQVVGETLRLWGAATRQSYRGRGAYRALVLERCRLGRHLGATLALAKANISTSGSILKRAGFHPVGTERRHVLKIHR